MFRLEARLPSGEPLGFFEEFQELSEGSRFARQALPEPCVRMTNPVCGDEVAVWIKLDGQTVRDYGYQQKGCWPVVGCLELWGQLLLGMTLDELQAVRLQEFLELVRDVPVSKRHAFSLSFRAVQTAASQQGTFSP